MTSSGSLPIADPSNLNSALAILVAEDDPDSRMLMQVYLKASGHTLEFAENGKVAVELSERKPYDLIFVDIQMPIMDGLTAIRQIRAQERARDARPTPILALSADACLEDRELSRQAGSTGHLSKPVSRQTILTAIVEHGMLGGGQPAALPINPQSHLVSPLYPLTGPIRIYVRRHFEVQTPRYLEDRRKAAAEMVRRLAAGDFERLRVFGHNLKGTAGAYGFPALTGLGADFERSARAADTEALSFDLQRISDYLTRVELAFPD